VKVSGSLMGKDIRFLEFELAGVVELTRVQVIISTQSRTVLELKVGNEKETTDIPIFSK